MNKQTKVILLISSTLLLITSGAFMVVNWISYFEMEQLVDYRQNIIDIKIGYGADPEDLVNDYANLAEAQAGAALYGSRTLIFGGFSVLIILNMIAFSKMKIDESFNQETHPSSTA